MAIRRLYAILPKMLSLATLFPPAPVFIWPLASTAKSLSSQRHVGKAILCGGIKWCYISPISPQLTIQTWLHAKFSTFILRIVDETWCRNINLWIHVKNEKRLVFFHLCYEQRGIFESDVSNILQQDLQLSNQTKWPCKANPIFVAEITLDIKAEIGYSKLKTKALFA